MSAQADSMLYDGVFEGDGVRGIGLAGALSVFEAAGYRPYSVAGTSAGAIVSTLVAAGYTAAEIKQIIMRIDFSKVEDPPLIGRIPRLGSIIDLIRHYGLYKGDYFHNLMRNLLAAKGVHTFRDLILSETAQDERYRYKVRVVTSDLVQGAMVVLPNNAAKSGVNPDDLDVSLAVRMDSLGIQATDFQITKAQSEALFNAGVEAAQQFLAGKGQGGLAATQRYTPAPVVLRPVSASAMAPRPLAMAAVARGRTLAPAVSPALTAGPPANPHVWNTLAIALVSLAIIAVLALQIAVMSGAVHLG
jgi:Patatin-like phospholipase